MDAESLLEGEKAASLGLFIKVPWSPWHGPGLRAYRQDLGLRVSSACEREREREEGLTTGFQVGL